MDGAASIAVGAGDTKTVNVSLIPLDATLTVNVLNTDGNPLSIEKPLWGIITAPLQRLFRFDLEIPASTSSATVKVVGGKTYDVNGVIANYGSTDVATVAVPTNGATSTTLTMSTAPTGAATFRLVDQNGNVVSAIRNVGLRLSTEVMGLR
jgi:hypothetical protein